MSRLSAASLRINANLDTVLGEVVKGARVLTGSHAGLITTVDDSGHPRGLVSSGRLAVDITTVLGPSLLALVQGRAVLRLARAPERTPQKSPARPSVRCVA